MDCKNEVKIDIWIKDGEIYAYKRLMENSGHGWRLMANSGHGWQNMQYSEHNLAVLKDLVNEIEKVINKR